MRDAPFWKFTIAFAAAAFAAACVLLYALRAWIMGRAHEREARRHIARLASEIVAVADTIAVDLVDVPRDSTIASLNGRARECQHRAEATLARSAGLRRIDIDRLNAHLELLHEEHRRIVNLRSDVDATLAALRGGRPVPGTRACHYTVRSRPQRSRWSSSGFHTRPSTIM